MSIRIAFAGAAQAGKDLAAQHLLGQHSGELLKFADLLHQGLRPTFDAYGFSYEKDRELLQFIASWARKKDPRVFLRPVQQAVALQPAANKLLTDMRNHNEVDCLLSLGFVLVKIERKDLPEPHAEWRKHESEHFLDNFDGWHYRVQNCGSLSHYLDQIDLLWKYIQSGEHTKHNFRCLTIE